MNTPSSPRVYRSPHPSLQDRRGAGGLPRAGGEGKGGAEAAQGLRGVRVLITHALCSRKESLRGVRALHHPCAVPACTLAPSRQSYPPRPHNHALHSSLYETQKTQQPTPKSTSEEQDAKSIVFALKRTLDRAGGYTEVFAIHRARIPIVKFRDASIPCPPPVRWSDRSGEGAQHAGSGSVACVGSHHSV